MGFITSPSTELYTIGRGILSIGPWTGSTPPTFPSGFVDVGNCPEISLNVSEEKLDHYAYRTGLKSIDKIVVLMGGYTVKFTLDEISVFNLTTFLRGTLAGNVIRANASMNKEFALYFVAANPLGELAKWLFHRCRIKPAGDFSMIGNDWSKLQYEAEGLSDVTNNADSPFFDVEYYTTTTEEATTTSA
jgi:hypothetical protein